MFSYLIGQLTEKEEGSITVEISGIGYSVNVSNNTLVTLPSIGEIAKVYTYLQVKDDDLVLYGFSTIDEKELFLKLITVTGIGPKGASSILSGLKISDLITAIIKEDVAKISSIKGLGKKTAERVVLELKDKLGVLATGTELFMEDITVDENVVNDATDVLISLGVNKNEAYRLARASAKEGFTTEEVISNALKGMGR